jgi:ABC-2 type transport system permease protein
VARAPVGSVKESDTVNAAKETLREGLRVVWAIAAKDIGDGVKNKMLISAVATVILVVAMYTIGPALWYGNRPLRLALYDAGNSRLASKLEGSEWLRLRKMSSMEEMEYNLGLEDYALLGLVLPSDFDQTVETGEQIEIEGYVDHWVSDDEIREKQLYFEEHLTQLIGKPVHIHINSGTVYTHTDGGHPFKVSLIMIVSLTMLGIMVTPHLILEEKETKTLDALLVSPAGAGQVVMGKALASLFFCLIAASLLLAVNARLIVHWGVAVLAVMCGSLFTIALGLLLGTVFEVKQQLNLWGFILLQPLLIPVFLGVLRDLLPEGVANAIRWMPTAALAQIFKVSLSASAPWARFGPQLALVSGCSLGVLIAVAWLVRRSDR